MPKITTNQKSTPQVVSTPKVAPPAAPRNLNEPSLASKRQRNELNENNQNTDSFTARTSRSINEQTTNQRPPTNQQAPKQQIRMFNSFDPNSSSVPLPNEVWTVAGQKKQQNRIANNNSMNNKTNQMNINRNSNQNNINSNHHKTKNRMSLTQKRDNKWLKSCGSNTDSAFPVQHRPFSIYFGRADNSCTVQTVKDWLDTKQIIHFNLKEITKKKSFFVQIVRF